MNENGDSSPQAEMEGPASWPCAECGHPVEVVPPASRVQFVNSPEVSVAVFQHPDPMFCERCGAAYVYTIAPTTRLDLNLSRVKQLDRRIVAAPGNLKLM